MGASAIFLAGVFTVALLAIFVYETIHELRKAGRESARSAEPGRGIPAAAPPAIRSPAPMRILVATDGSPCSDVAVRSIALRPWASGSEIAVITVVHAKVPFVPDITLAGAAAYSTTLEDDRREAPVRIRVAEQALAAIPGVTVRSTVLEGDPEGIILEEADRWKADLIVVGSHGYGAARRLMLGSVSQGVAAHASCSVEIVRCPRPPA